MKIVACKSYTWARAKGVATNRDQWREFDETLRVNIVSIIRLHPPLSGVQDVFRGYVKTLYC